MAEHEEIIDQMQNEPCTYEIRNLSTQEIENDIETLRDIYSRINENTDDAEKVLNHLEALKRELATRNQM